MQQIHCVLRTNSYGDTDNLSIGETEGGIETRPYDPNCRRSQEEMS